MGRGASCGECEDCLRIERNAVTNQPDGGPLSYVQPGIGHLAREQKSHLTKGLTGAAGVGTVDHEALSYSRLFNGESK
ncbi:hypothetical protein VTN77DRAFT_5564 [Rasamsonia byssochlamydoides]|uniref:uncharacterized protein n=1 Tax=Rasamsonia byssochlamydoides TaxID=89139 RepID=UPI003742D149